jgi:hypothetical protein
MNAVRAFKLREGDYAAPLARAIDRCARLLPLDRKPGASSGLPGR